MQFKPLEKKDRENLHAMIGGGYLHGSCYTLAIALHRGTGHPIIGIRRPGKTEIHHAAVQLPDGSFFDARGNVPDFDTLIQPFSEYQEYDLVKLTEEELRAAKPIEDYAITSTVDRARAIWPELEWNDKNFAGKAKGFLEELEALSSKWNVWIRGAYPNAKPILCEGHGDESYVANQPWMVRATFSTVS